MVKNLSITAISVMGTAILASHEHTKTAEAFTILSQSLASHPMIFTRSSTNQPSHNKHEHQYQTWSHLRALSKYFENDLVSVSISYKEDDEEEGQLQVQAQVQTPRAQLFVVQPDLTLAQLCTHADDNPTDLWIDPRTPNNIVVEDDEIIKCYGEGWYSQRVVPSLGGGPGYGAEADPIWSIDEDVLEEMQGDGVEVPSLDLGIAHGEKARGGAI